MHAIVRPYVILLHSFVDFEAKGGFFGKQSRHNFINLVSFPLQTIQEDIFQPQQLFSCFTPRALSKINGFHGLYKGWSQSFNL